MTLVFQKDFVVVVCVYGTMILSGPLVNSDIFLLGWQLMQ